MAVGNPFAIRVGGSDNGYLQGTRINQGFPISIEAWVYPMEYSESTAAIVQTEGHSTLYTGFLFAIISMGRLALQIGNGGTMSNENRRNYATVDGVPLNKWSHVCFTCSDINNVKFYINGVLQVIGETSGTGTTVAYKNTAPLLIGHYAAGSVTLNSLIDEVRIWNKVLTQDEILKQMRKDLSLASLSDNLIAYWKFDEGTGTTANDLVNSNTLSFVNSPSWVESGVVLTDIYCLIKDSNNKIYTIQDGQKVDIEADNLTQSHFVEHGLTDLSVLTTENKDGIKPIYLFDSPKVLTWTNYPNPIKVQKLQQIWNSQRYLLSFDDKNTWKTYKNGQWMTVSLDDIYTLGMTKDELQSLRELEFSKVFVRHKLDFAIAFSNQHNREYPVIRKLTFNFPANTAPTLQNVRLLPDVAHNEYVEFRSKVIDREGDTFTYQVYINDVQVYPSVPGEWSPVQEYETNIYKAYKYPDFKLGNNTFKIILKDERNETSEWVYNVLITNVIPTVTVIYNEFGLVATVGDSDRDKVGYRIFINGTLVSNESAYTKLSQSPYQITYHFTPGQLKLNEVNKIRIEVIDEMGETASVDFEITGTHIGLMFTDENGDYYSDQFGNILKYLNFGVIKAGESSNMKTVYVRNQTADTLTNITLKIVNRNFDLLNKVFISKTDKFIPQEELVYPERIESGEAIAFDIRIDTDIEALTGGNFEIIATADPVE